MRILADENFPRTIVESLRKQDHDVLWARTDCPGQDDRKLLERAELEERVIFTLDKDFWHIALQRPTPLERCGVILFRVFPATPDNLGPIVNLTLRAKHPWVRHVSIVTKNGIEMISLAR